MRKSFFVCAAHTEKRGQARRGFGRDEIFEVGKLDFLTTKILISYFP